MWRNEKENEIVNRAKQINPFGEAEKKSRDYCKQATLTHTNSIQKKFRFFLARDPEQKNTLEQVSVRERARARAQALPIKSANLHKKRANRLSIQVATDWTKKNSLARASERSSLPLTLTASHHTQLLPPPTVHTNKFERYCSARNARVGETETITQVHTQKHTHTLNMSITWKSNDCEY